MYLKGEEINRTWLSSKDLCASGQHARCVERGGEYAPPTESRYGALVARDTILTCGVGVAGRRRGMVHRILARLTSSVLATVRFTGVGKPTPAASDHCPVGVDLHFFR